MKKSHRPNKGEQYQAKRIEKIVESKVNEMNDLIKLAFEKGCILQDKVSYQDGIYDIEFGVREDVDGTLRPSGKGLIKGADSADVDYMRFFFDKQLNLSGYFNFQWGRSKGDVHFEHGKLAGLANIQECVDGKMISRSNSFAFKSICAFLAVAGVFGAVKSEVQNQSHSQNASEAVYINNLHVR